jgi:Bacterial Ig-like domain
MRGRLAWVACSALLLSGATAAACPAIPRTYSLDGVVPAAGAVGVPLNTPLFIPLVHPPPGALWTGSLVSNQAPLTELSTQANITVTFDSIGPPTGGALTFVPQQTLKPNTTYAVDLGEPPLQAADAGPPPKPTWQFTTGDALQPPLRLKGELSVTFEAGTDPVFVCSAPPVCGNPCTQNGEKNVTKARVELPAGFDGFADLGAEGDLQITENVPPGQNSDAVSFERPMVVAGEPSEVVVTMPMRKDGAVYPPCFDFTLMDARRDRATTRLCLDSFPLPAGDVDTMHAMGGEPATGVDTMRASGGEPSTAAAKVPTHTSTACSYAPARGTQSSAVLLLAGALTLARRRRSRSAL